MVSRPFIFASTWDIVDRPVGTKARLKFAPGACHTKFWELTESGELLYFDDIDTLAVMTTVRVGSGVCDFNRPLLLTWTTAMDVMWSDSYQFKLISIMHFHLTIKFHAHTGRIACGVVQICISTDHKFKQLKVSCLFQNILLSKPQDFHLGKKDEPDRY